MHKLEVVNLRVAVGGREILKGVNLSVSSGEVVVVMLRSLLGDEVFRRGLKTFLERYRYKAVDVEDLRKVFEEVSERDLEWFWNQFFYSAGHPVLKVSWNYSM